jgi:hypothetical protein
MVVVVARQVRLLVLLVIHRRIVGIFQLNVARHVAVVILLVADAVAGHHLHLLMLVTLVAATPTTGRRSATASATTSAATAGSVLILAIRRLILRPVFPVLLDPFVLCPPILEPNFDLDKGNKCLS